VAQLSRPYQIALVAVVLLGLVWAVALRGHSSNPSEPAPASSPAPTASTPSPAPSTSASEAKAAAAPTPVYHGAAPGVEGLTRAIAKAHGAVAESQQNAQQLQRKSSEASQEAQSTPEPVRATTRGTGTAAGATSTTHTSARAKTGHVKPRGGRSPQQALVESELAHGRTVMLLFWNPRSTVDQEVMAQAGVLARGSRGSVALHAALAHQVDAFGKITEVAHVYQTPTILIVNRHGVVSTFTGLTDVYSLQQALREARSAHS
jgi:hypothetical protein